jgi:hypothetical protein
MTEVISRKAYDPDLSDKLVVHIYDEQWQIPKGDDYDVMIGVDKTVFNYFKATSTGSSIFIPIDLSADCWVT